MKTKLTIGQKLYVVDKDFRGIKSEPQEATVTKVGNKYFELSEYHNTKFSLETTGNVSEYSSSLFCYTSLAEIEDEISATKLNDKLKKFFEWRSNLSLDQLRRIDVIISETK